jgi:hypothetical protein
LFSSLRRANRSGTAYAASQLGRPIPAPRFRRGPRLPPHVHRDGAAPRPPLTIVPPRPTGEAVHPAVTFDPQDPPAPPTDLGARSGLSSGSLGCHPEAAGIRPRAAASDGVGRGTPVQGRLAHHLNHLHRQDAGRLGISATPDDQDAYDSQQPSKRDGLPRRKSLWRRLPKSFHRASIRSPIPPPLPRNPATTSDPLKPSWGLEPQTPSLPWKCSTS